ncbi:MAG TPA: homoserine O-succinyltransferase [Tissierellaceae bacterium]|nr:homoserine O-succinyltransferase [Tissierellaceae bacterium]
MFGVYPHYVHHRKVPLLRGFDDMLYIPHSRHTTVSQKEIEANPELTILSDSKEAGVFLVMAEEGRQIFMFGRPEYDRMTLDKEYKRDKAKNLPIQLPKDYYPDDNPDNKPVMTWRAHSNAIYSNWLNYYVYQVTPYEL